jgi:polyvinyl alcohol dehydrogenase (cytochrome)
MAADGEAVFKLRCAGCHDTAQPAGRIPPKAELSALPPEAIVRTLQSGSMMIQGSALSDEERHDVARFLTGKDVAPVSTAPMSGMCTKPAPKFAPQAGDWNGWSIDDTNSRYQPNPALKAEDVPRLKLKWAFGFPNGSIESSQPVVVGGRLFVGSDSGDVYSLDASTGCIYWSYAAGALMRNAVKIAQVNGKYAAFFGDARANEHAVDVETGKLLWKTKVEDHPISRLTGSPTFYNGKIYFGVSSFEEFTAALGDYKCCTFRGSVVALDAATGKQVWKSRTVLDPPKEFRKNKSGAPMLGPAGAAVWNTPAIDAKRKMVYVATGDSYTDVDINTSDAILAFDLDTGSLKWVKQVTAHDNYITGCPAGTNCPAEDGPDFDFGSSVIVRNLPNGKQILVVAQKSGVVYGLDPDKRGDIVWETRVGSGGVLGGVEFGHAADLTQVYAAVSDKFTKRGDTPQPGISALDIATGKKIWSTPAPKVTCASPRGCLPAQSAAISVMPGAVFSGAVNGHFRAYSTKDGSILWDFDTAVEFDTVNKVKAHGSSIDGAGPAIAHGMVYTNSGYGSLGGAPGNVLLAFSVDGK